MTGDPDSAPGEREPDPRFILASERTFLAWVRTVLALVAGAVALHSLEIPDETRLRNVLVLLMLAFAALVMVLADRRRRAVERAMRLNEPLPPFRLGTVVTGAVVVAAVVLLIALR